MNTALTLDGLMPTLTRARLLMVDDQPTNIQVLYHAFAQDHQVFIATSGEQALALCASKQPDLVLLDIEMPGMDGFEVCRRLKADAATRDIPVIFVTSHSDETAQTHGLEVGAVDFIIKPISPKVVRARVKTHLTLKAQSDLLRQWTCTDTLTGVFNRRYFDECLAQEWGRAQRNDTPLSLILIDLDYFKRYNERYGHPAGDECLRRVAASLKANMQRHGDLLARFGDEEFVCLLPLTTPDGAVHMAQLLGKAIFDQQIAHADSSVAPVLTVSLGVCGTHGKNANTADKLLRTADAQLYLAKAQGRNQTRGTDLSEDLE